MKVTRTLIHAQATILAREHGIQEFKGSSTWATPFLKKFKLSLRRTTNMTTLTDSQLIQQSVDFMTPLRSTLPGIALEKILLMDETAIYFKDCRTQTIDYEGRKNMLL